MKPTRFHDSHKEERPSKKPIGARIEFGVDKQYKLIEDRGYKVQWEKSFLCTCRNPMTKAPDPSCNICHGRGTAYLPAKDIIVAIQNQEKSMQNMDLGLYDSGTAIGTSMPDSAITFRDRITLPDVEIQHSLVFDVTQKRINDGFWLPYDVKRIEYSITDNGELIYETDDYLFDEEANKFYPREHLKGKNVSLNITTLLRYIVIDLLKESRLQYSNKGTALEQVDHLPKKLLLKREDAWVNPAPFSMGDDVEEPVEAEEYKRPMTKGGFFGGALDG